MPPKLTSLTCTVQLNKGNLTARNAENAHAKEFSAFCASKKYSRATRPPNMDLFLSLPILGGQLTPATLSAFQKALSVALLHSAYSNSRLCKKYMRGRSHAATSEGSGFSPPVQPATCVGTSYKLASMLSFATDSDLTCDPHWAHYALCVPFHCIPQSDSDSHCTKHHNVALLGLPGHTSAGNENVMELVCLHFSTA